MEYQQLALIWQDVTSAKKINKIKFTKKGVKYQCGCNSDTTKKFEISKRTLISVNSLENVNIA